MILLLRWIFLCTLFFCVKLYITRLPCILYANFNLASNKYFKGDIALTHFEVNNINECGIYCVRLPDCVFSNFNANQKTCQLMSSVANSLNSITDSQWQVLSTDFASNKNIGPICESNTSCGIMYCRDICLTDDQGLVHSYTCLETTDISKISNPSSSSNYGTNANSGPMRAIDGNINTDAITHNGGFNWI